MPVDRRDECCLCAKQRAQIGKLLVGLRGAVCSDCINLCSDILGAEPKFGPVEVRTEGYQIDIPEEIAKFFTDPQEVLEILRFLTQTVGQRATRHALDNLSAKE